MRNRLGLLGKMSQDVKPRILAVKDVEKKLHDLQKINPSELSLETIDAWKLEKTLRELALMYYTEVMADRKNRHISSFEQFPSKDLPSSNWPRPLQLLYAGGEEMDPKGGSQVIEERDDMRERMELRRLFGLRPTVTPDSRGLIKLVGLLKDASGRTRFQAADFVHAMREE